MNLTYDIDNKTKFLVIYQCVTRSVRSINKYTEIPLSTIHSWINKIEQGIDIMEKKQGGGTKPKITPELKHQIQERAASSPLSTSTRKLAAEFHVGKGSAHLALREGGFKFKSIRSLKELNKKEKENRVNFSRDMLKRKSYQLKTTFFSDEMGINLSDAYQKKVWQGPQRR